MRTMLEKIIPKKTMTFALADMYYGGKQISRRKHEKTFAFPARHGITYAHPRVGDDNGMPMPPPHGPRIPQLGNKPLPTTQCDFPYRRRAWTSSVRWRERGSVGSRIRTAVGRNNPGPMIVSALDEIIAKAL